MGNGLFRVSGGVRKHGRRRSRKGRYMYGIAAHFLFNYCVVPLSICKDNANRGHDKIMRFIFRVLLAAAADVRSVCMRRQCRSEELLRRFNGDFLTSGFAHEVSHNGRKFYGNAGWCEP